MSGTLDTVVDPSSSTPTATNTPSNDEVAESNPAPENNVTEPSPEEQTQTVVTVAITEPETSSSSSPSPLQPSSSKVFVTSAEAIANFRPSSREVVRGIAPHVFDERKRRRSHSRARSRSPKPYWYAAAGGGEKHPSPLRGATVISWDEHSIYLEQPDTAPIRTPSIDRKDDALVASLERSPFGDSDSLEQSFTQSTTMSNRRFKIDKVGWKHFRVDIRLFKSIGVKLRLATSLTPSTKPRL